MTVRALDNEREQSDPGDARVDPSAMEQDTTPKLADGTRSHVTIASATKGLRIATRCATIAQFVETYHQVCEDAAIFIPNTQRPVETVMQFRFDLADGNPALLGVGIVVEELTTKRNRFNHVGIVVELQRLSRASEITFDQMLAARARIKPAVPAPIYPRAMTVPVQVMEPPKPAPRPVPIPLPCAPSLAPARPKTMIGLPAVTKKTMETVRIPAIIAPPVPKPPIVPTPVVAATAVPSSIDDGWESIANNIVDAPAPPVVQAAAPVVVIEPAVPVAEEAIEISEENLTAVDDLALASADAHQALAVPFVDTGTAVTVLERRVASVTEPDPFDTVTAVETPDTFLLALMRGDGRAAVATVSEPLEPAAPPTAIPITVAPIELEPPALAVIPASAPRRPRRWLAAAGAFALLLCVTVATTVFVKSPAAAVPPSTSFAAAHEAPADSFAMATVRDEAPPAAPAAKPVPPRAVTPLAVVKVRPRVLPPRPAARPFRRPAAPKKCTDLRCL